MIGADSPEASSAPAVEVSGAMVRGTAFLGLIAYIRDTRGPDALSRVVQAAGAETQAAFSERIRKLGWYPYGAYARFLRAADAELGKGDLSFCEKLGTEASRRDLNTVFAFFTRLYGPERLVRSCTRVWLHYYRDAGHMQAVSWDPDDTVLRIHDFPEMDPGHCRLMVGWMWRAMDLVGGRVITGSETLCTSSGGPYHEFTCRWR